jgi:hypothetical protein
MRARHLGTIIPLLAIGLSGVAAAQSIKVEPARCFKFGDNQAVYASTAAEPPGASERLYFQWTDHPAYYWVDMTRDSPGRYWGIPPKPESRNTEIEYYAVLLDAASHEISRSAMIRTKVTSDCQIKLTPQQMGDAQNLVIGETDDKQKKNRILGFLCDGIVTRVNIQNIKRPDEVCRTCVVAWWQDRGLLLTLAGAGAAGGVTTIVIDKPEPSPSRPTRE